MKYLSKHKLFLRPSAWFMAILLSLLLTTQATYYHAFAQDANDYRPNIGLAKH
jgi:hypothetical protein